MQKSYEVTGAFVVDSPVEASFELTKAYVAGNKTEAYNAFREETQDLAFNVWVNTDEGEQTAEAAVVRPGAIRVAKGIKPEVEFTEDTEDESEETEDEVVHAREAVFEDEDEDPVEDRMVEVASEVADEMREAEVL